jgi:DNA-binding response OmpR family regulator
VALAKILLVQDDPGFRDDISDYLKNRATVELAHAPTGAQGAAMIAGGSFDVAVIDANLPDMSCIELAKLAANENIPVLMLSGNRRVSEELRRLDYRFLETPCSADVLLSESRRLLREREENIGPVRSSTAIAERSLRALRAEVTEAYRLFDAIVLQLGYLNRSSQDPRARRRGFS